jgi:hypothetical protein
MACVSDMQANKRSVWLTIHSYASLLNVERHGIQQMNGIALLREPERVNAWATADVVNSRGHWWQMTRNKLLGAHTFNLTCLAKEPPGFVKLLIMTLHFW